jgi:hypothetical protein
MAYMPLLNSDNTLMPASMYFKYRDTALSELFYIPVAVCRVNGNIVWT